MWGKVRRELMGTPRACFGVPDTKHPGKGWQEGGWGVAQFKFGWFLSAPEFF